MIKASLIIDEVDVDLFDDEQVIISDSIKSTKDVANVSTSYTREFRLPASKKNNKLFQHYYNTLIRNGFDSRRKHDALIKINGADFKKGYIKLNGVDMEDNKAAAYRVQFFGEMSSLKDKMGEDMLEDLTALARYNHDYDLATVKSGFESALKSTGSGLIVDDDGELIYPFISHTRGFKYDANGLSDVTIAGVPTSTDRLDFDDLKPAIKVDQILYAMEYKYGISFAGDFRQTDMFQELFMWLHREKGFVRNGSEVENLNFQGAITTFDPATRPAPELELSLDSGDEQRDLQTYGQVGGQKGKNYKCKFEVQTADPGTYTMIVKAIPYFTNGEPLDFVLTNQNGNSDPLEFELFSYGVGLDVEYWQIWVYVNAENTISSITPIVTIDEYFGDTLTDTGVYGNSAEGIVKYIDIPTNMPKMRCIDFIRGLYRMFNLVAYDQNEAVYSSNSEIVLEPLDDFYDSGSVSQLSPYVDVSSASVERVEPFNLIEFKYPEPKTLFAKKSNEVQRVNFGDARFDSSSLSQGDVSFLYDGGAYSVEVPFEKSQYERIENASTGLSTQIQWGWFVNDFEENEPEPEIGEPLLFLRNHRDCDTDTIEWSDTSVTNTKYNSPSNVSTDQEFTLNFDAEVDEYTLVVNENGLFNKFYKRFIEGIYDIDARRYIVEMYLPAERIFNYKLNDKVVINHTAFNIEDIKINMSTRKARLELLKITARAEVYVVEPRSLLKGLSASYSFEQNTLDNTSNALDFTWSGSETYDAGGAAGFSIQASNRSGATVVSDKFNINGGAFSVSFWYQKNDAQDLTILKLFGGGTGNAFEVKMLSSGGADVYLYDGTVDHTLNYRRYQETAAPISNNTWYHIAISVTASGDITLWRDKQEETNPTISDTGTFNQIIDSDKLLTVGDYLGASGKGAVKLDEVNFWLGRELIQEDVNRLYASATRAYPFGF
jgi:hypothetical protein